MIELVLYSLFTLLICAIAFASGVKLACRFFREKDAAVHDARLQVEQYHTTHFVSLVDQSRRPSMAPPVPMQPAVYAAKHEALAPGGPVDTRLQETGHATFLFPSKPN